MKGDFFGLAAGLVGVPTEGLVVGLTVVGGGRYGLERGLAVCLGVQAGGEQEDCGAEQKGGGGTAHEKNCTSGGTRLICFGPWKMAGKRAG